MTRHAVSNPAAGIPRGLLATCIAVVAVVVIPIVVTIVQAIQGGASAARDALGASSTTTLLLHTVLLAAIATPVAGVIGVAGAWFVERTRLPCRRVWAVLLVAPLTMPLFVTSYAWATLGRPLQGFWGAAGIVAFSYFPIVYLLVAVALRGLDPALEETARSLGLSARQTFFRVVLPQLRPALLGGLLLVALDTLVEFDAFVALKFQTFSLGRLRPVPARLQRLGRSRAVVLLDRAVPRPPLRRGAASRPRQLHAGQPGRPSSLDPRTTSDGGPCPCSPASPSSSRSASASPSRC